jgi:RNA polymerase sigma-70 factor (ECF subfamily)
MTIESPIDAPVAPAGTGGGASALEPPAPAARLQAVARQQGGQLLAWITRNMPASLRGHLDPEDLLQETLVEAFRRTQARAVGADDDTSLRLLYVMARRQVGMAIRAHRAAKRQGHRRVADVSGTEADAVDLLDQYALYTRTPSQSAARHEAMVAVEQSLALLPPEWERVIRLRYVEGLSVREASGMLGKSENAVMVLSHRALRLLRRKMGSASRYA